MKKSPQISKKLNHVGSIFFLNDKVQFGQKNPIQSKKKKKRFNSFISAMYKKFKEHPSKAKTL